MRLLFLGNSATYVHEIPQTLARLAAEVGCEIEIEQITPGGCTLAAHADGTTEHGQRVLREIARGYDLVILQDNGNCVSNEEKRAACVLACRVLAEAARESGARLCFYVRPPYGTEAFGRTPFEQCRAFDELFGELAAEHHACCAYVNRAFAYAMTHLPYDLWGDDHAHTSRYGAYLAICVFFATLFGRSATQLAPDGLPFEAATALQEVADRIALDGLIPWENA